MAKDLGITLGSFEFRVQGDLDTAVLVTGEDGNANFDAVTVEATVTTDASPEQFDRFVAEVERRCPVSQLFIRSGLRFTNRWSARALES